MGHTSTIIWKQNQGAAADVLFTRRACLLGDSTMSPGEILAAVLGSSALIAGLFELVRWFLGSRVRENTGAREDFDAVTERMNDIHGTLMRDNQTLRGRVGDLETGRKADAASIAECEARCRRCEDDHARTRQQLDSMSNTLDSLRATIERMGGSSD